MQLWRVWVTTEAPQAGHAGADDYPRMSFARHLNDARYNFKVWNFTS